MGGQLTLPLTRSECATITMIGQDLSQKAIADALGVAPSTVGTFASRVYGKLGVRGPAAAALLHRDIHPWCGSRVDFEPILERIKGAQRDAAANDTTQPSRRGRKGHFGVVEKHLQRERPRGIRASGRALIVRPVENAEGRGALKAVAG